MKSVLVVKHNGKTVIRGRISLTKSPANKPSSLERYLAAKTNTKVTVEPVQPTQ